MHVRLVTLGSVAALAFAGCSGQPASVDRTDGGLTIELLGARALVGSELTVVPDPVITIDGEEIVGIGSGSDTSPSQTIDASGLTLLPGFIDAHVHLALSSGPEVVAGGVTTVRDLAWPPEAIFNVAEASRRRGFDGPTVLAAGPMLTADGGYPTRAGWAPEGTGWPVGSPSAARAAVSDLVDRGADVIKIALNPGVGPTLDGSTLGAIVDAAHGSGLKVTGHVSGLEQLDKALDAGVDELAHMLMSSEAIPDRTIARMVEAGMVVVPTMSIRFRRDRRIAIDNLRRFRAAGGRVVYGTDLGNAGPRPGIDEREVDAMTKAGYTGAEIVRSATVDAAAWLELVDRGVLAEGMRADIIGVRGNPLANPNALTKVRLVIRAGRVIKGP